MSNQLINKLREDYPNINFSSGDIFYWSPKNRTVYFSELDDTAVTSWSLLHEVSHGVLEHTSYGSDFQLVQLEVAAWEKANLISKQYKIEIDQDHIQDCLDTYRDWLHRRSTCPACSTVSAQNIELIYNCPNCKASWSVSGSRFCRPYRKISKK